MEFGVFEIMKLSPSVIFYCFICVKVNEKEPLSLNNLILSLQTCLQIPSSN